MRIKRDCAEQNVIADKHFKKPSSNTWQNVIADKHYKSQVVTPGKGKT